MRIVQLNCTYGNKDSTGRSVLEFHRHLLDCGHESYVFASVIHEDETDAGVNVFSSGLDKKIHSLGSRVFGRQGFFSYFSTRKLIEHLKSISPDVVLLHVLHSNCVNFPLLFKYLSVNNVAVVLVLHDCWYYTGHCCHYTEVGCNKWKEHCGTCTQIHQWNKSWFFDHSKSLLKQKSEWYSQLSKLAVVGVSDWITNEARQSILKNADVIRRIYNWIDLETFKPQNTDELRKQLGILPTEKVLLGVATAWNVRKGLSEMQLAAKIPNTKVILVGGVPEDMEQPSNMICVGRIKSAEKLAQYYSLADVFLNPSVQETFGKTTAEALSCGTPVVVYNTTACPELVGKGCGEVVNLGDRFAFTKRVEYILENPEFFDNGREWARNTFDMKSNMQDYIKMMSEIINS